MKPAFFTAVGVETTGPRDSQTSTERERLMVGIGSTVDHNQVLFF